MFYLSLCNDSLLKKENSHVKPPLIWETSASLQLKSLKHKLRRIPALDWWVSTCKNKPMFTFPSSTMVQMCAVRYTCVGPIRHASKAVSGTSISIILTPTAPVHTPAPYFFFNSAIAANDFSATSVVFFSDMIRHCLGKPTNAVAVGRALSSHTLNDPGTAYYQVHTHFSSAMICFQTKFSHHRPFSFFIS